MITSSAIAFSIGNAFMKSGVVGSTGPSAPFSHTSTAAGVMPAFASTSFSRGPRQVALPIAP